MKKQIIGIGMVLLLLPIVFAFIAGENFNVEFTGDVSECYIYDGNGIILNNSFEEGLDFIENINLVQIDTNIKLAPGNYIVSCLVEELREEHSASSSSGSGYVPDWSAKCGYNKECLYGSSNQTINQTTNETVDASIDTPADLSTEEPPIEEEGMSTIATILLGFLVLNVVGTLIFLLWKVFKSKPEEEDYDINNTEVINNDKSN